MTPNIQISEPDIDTSNLAAPFRQLFDGIFQAMPLARKLSEDFEVEMHERRREWKDKARGEDQP